MDIGSYFSTLVSIHAQGNATEHSYRAALQSLFDSIDPAVKSQNEPKRLTDVGAPDFSFHRGDVVVRRKFYHAWEVRGPRWADAKKVVQTIDRLFEIERELKGQAPAVRLAERMRFSEPIVDRLFLELGAIQSQILMKDAFGDAINYTLKLRDGLRIFLSDGRVEMDNNLVENVIRPLALIRKNSLFAGSTLGGEIWAMLSSLIGTCKLNGVEPYAYLTWVFERIAAKLPLAEYHKLFPWHCPIGRYPNDVDEPEAS